MLWSVLIAGVDALLLGRAELGSVTFVRVPLPPVGCFFSSFNGRPEHFLSVWLSRGEGGRICFDGWCVVAAVPLPLSDAWSV